MSSTASKRRAIEVEAPRPEAAREGAEVRAHSGDAALAATVEAVLLSSDRPLSVARIAEACGAGGEASSLQTIRDVIASLNGVYDSTGRSFRIEQVAGGYRLMTRPEYAGAVAAVRGAKESQALSRAAVETLAIIAYRQPITRADVEAIRGVSTGEVLKTLMERRLVTIVGRAEELGRPMLYGTTRQFLEAFGLSGLRDLPEVEELAGFAPGPPERPERPERDEDATTGGAGDREKADS